MQYKSVFFTVCLIGSKLNQFEYYCKSIIVLYTVLSTTGPESNLSINTVFQMMAIPGAPVGLADPGPHLTPVALLMKVLIYMVLRGKNEWEVIHCPYQII